MVHIICDCEKCTKARDVTALDRVFFACIAGAALALAFLMVFEIAASFRPEAEPIRRTACF